ncbi:MAG: ABC transporter permease, partial [Idiomarina sp.]|nr:ABC transporter permease [Idiomarina sp.]
MIQFLQSIGRQVLDSLAGIGYALAMLMSAIIGKPQPSKSWPLFVKQMYVVGVLSMLIVIVS